LTRAAYADQLNKTDEGGKGVSYCTNVTVWTKLSSAKIVETCAVADYLSGKTGRWGKRGLRQRNVGEHLREEKSEAD